MNDENTILLLQLLVKEDGQSLPRLAKRLSMAQSELLRLASELGDAEHHAGMNLVEWRQSGARRDLWLTPKGRALCAQ